MYTKQHNVFYKDMYSWGTYEGEAIGNENLKKKKVYEKERRKTQSGSDMALIGNVDGKLLNSVSFVHSLTHSHNKYSIHGQGTRSR